MQKELLLLNDNAKLNRLSLEEGVRRMKTHIYCHIEYNAKTTVSDWLVASYVNASELKPGQYKEINAMKTQENFAENVKKSLFT